MVISLDHYTRFKFYGSIRRSIIVSAIMYIFRLYLTYVLIMHFKFQSKNQYFITYYIHIYLHLYSNLPLLLYLNEYLHLRLSQSFIYTRTLEIRNNTNADVCFIPTANHTHHQLCTLRTPTLNITVHSYARLRTHVLTNVYIDVQR